MRKRTYQVSKHRFSRYSFGEILKQNSPLLAALSEEYPNYDVPGNYARWLELRGLINVYYRYGQYPRKPLPAEFYFDTRNFDWPSNEYDFLNEKKWLRKARISAGITLGVPGFIGRCFNFVCSSICVLYVGLVAFVLTALILKS